MGAYNELDIMVQDVSMTPKEYDSNKELVSDYLSGDSDIKSLPQRLQDVIHEWEREQNEYYGTSTEEQLVFLNEEGW